MSGGAGAYHAQGDLDTIVNSGHRGRFSPGRTRKAKAERREGESRY